MKVISIINYKGGVGKTTLAANIGMLYAKKNKRVLIIDVDPQCSLTFSFINLNRWRNRYEKKTVKDYIDYYIYQGKNMDINDIIIRNFDDRGIDLISSHLGLIYSEMELSATLKNAVTNYQVHYMKILSILRNALKSVNDEYDLVLFDCPPNFNLITQCAIIASCGYVVPTKLDYLSTLGIEELNKHIEELINNYNAKVKKKKIKGFKPVYPQFYGVIPTMVSMRNNELISVNKHYLNVLKNLNIDVFDTYIRDNKSAYSQSPILNGQGPHVLEIERLVEELMRRVDL